MKFIVSLIALSVVGLALWFSLQSRNADPYVAFSSRHLTGTDQGYSFHKLPIDSEFQLSQMGIGSITLHSSPSEIVQVVGKPTSMGTFASIDGEVPFYFRVHHSQFSFRSRKLYRAYLQLSDFPNVKIAGYLVKDLDRKSAKDLGFPVISEGRQDLQFEFSKHLHFTIGFVSDGPSPSGRPFYISFQENTD